MQIAAPSNEVNAADVDGEIRLNKGRWVGRIARANGQSGAGQNYGWKCGGELYVDLVKAHLPRRQANETWGQQNNRSSWRRGAYHPCENIERT
jgi:hypothetical protein